MYDAEGQGDKFMPFHRAGYDTKTGQVSHTSSHTSWHISSHTSRHTSCHTSWPTNSHTSWHWRKLA